MIGDHVIIHLEAKSYVLEICFGSCSKVERKIGFVFQLDICGYSTDSYCYKRRNVFAGKVVDDVAVIIVRDTVSLFKVEGKDRSRLVPQRTDFSGGTLKEGFDPEILVRSHSKISLHLHILV